MPGAGHHAFSEVDTGWWSASGSGLCAYTVRHEPTAAREFEGAARLPADLIGRGASGGGAAGQERRGASRVLRWPVGCRR
jgi:hypothetical protein